MNSTSSGLYRGAEWITRLAYVNVLWIGFTLAGVIVLGLFPATAAMFAIIRKWLNGNTDIPIFKTFWEIYKSEFWKSNLLGLIILLISLLLYFDFLFLRYNETSAISWMIIPFYLITLFFFLFLLYIFPTFVHFDLKVAGVMKNAFLIMLLNPLITILMLICIGSLYVIMSWLPGLFFIFGGSVNALVIMWLCNTAFSRTRKKQEQKEHEESK